jgi:hypothetical protein
MPKMTIQLEPFEFGGHSIPRQPVVVTIDEDGKRHTHGGLFSGDLRGFKAVLDDAYIGIDELGAAGGPHNVIGWHPVYIAHDGRTYVDHLRIDTITVQA